MVEAAGEMVDLGIQVLGVLVVLEIQGVADLVDILVLLVDMEVQVADLGDRVQEDLVVLVLAGQVVLGTSGALPARMVLVASVVQLEKMIRVALVVLVLVLIDPVDLERVLGALVVVIARMMNSKVNKGNSPLHMWCSVMSYSCGIQ